MNVKSTQDIKPFTSPTGEVVREIFGKSANGLNEFSIAHITIKPNGSGLSHYHPKHYEAYYMLEGIASLTINDKTKQIRAGDTVLLKLNDIHNIENKTKEDVKFIAFCSPSWDPECSVFVD
jgi:mannose-6-phosphate isomerase-like protein (cupin superfamily)